MSKTEGSNSENKPKQKFMCCSCFGKKRSDSSTIIGLPEQNEPYEYVVEKLAIKKIPLRLFATAEDLEKQSKTISSNSTESPSIATQKSEKEEPARPALEEKKSSVTFSTYYKLVSENDIDEHISHSPLPQQESSVTSLSDDEQEKEVCTANFHVKMLPKKVLTEDEEKQLVSHILNKHSSLFTLDTKEPIPKDPDNLPKDKVVVPPCVQAALNCRQQQFPPIYCRKQIPVDVHRTSDPLPIPMSSIKTPGSIQSSKRELTPELKQTINALGFAQRPHMPGIPPKNQRSIQRETVSDGSTENELGCNVLAGDEMVERISSQEISCHPLELKEKRGDKRILSRPLRKKPESVTVESLYEESDYHSFESSEGIMSRFGMDTMTKQCTTAQNNKSLLTIPDKSCNQIRIMPIHEAVGTSEPQMQDSEQITEISQLKGQSLKWKIIIKHHSDNKDKEGKATSAKSDVSDTELESLSPHR